MRNQTNNIGLGVIAAAVVVIVSAAGVLSLNNSRAMRAANLERAGHPLVTRNETEIRNRDIAFYTRRTEEDPAGASDRETLARLLFSRSRYTGSTGDLARAESLARKSVALRTERNGQAFELLASVLMTRHAFREAQSVAARADSLNPDTPAHLALLGEIELELGEYDSASSHFRAIHYDGEQFTIGARLARWYELTGRADIARQLLARSITRVLRRDDLPREQVAWFYFRMGELEMRAGRLSAADSAFHNGLAINPEDLRILGGLARVQAARGNWQSAIDYGARATAIQLDPATVGTMSTAYAALGDSVQSASFANAMAISALRQPGTIHRAWGLFLLDHGTQQDRAEVLRRARRDIRERHDVYGHDLLAWALFKTDHPADARTEMSLALAQHTEDILLAEHARAIGIAPAIASATGPGQ